MVVLEQVTAQVSDVFEKYHKRLESDIFANDVTPRLVQSGAISHEEANKVKFLTSNTTAMKVGKNTEAVRHPRLRIFVHQRTTYFSYVHVCIVCFLNLVLGSTRANYAQRRQMLRLFL